MEKNETYSEAFTKLHALMDEIAQGEMDIDLLSEKVREASRLLKLCQEKLRKTDEEVKKILEELQ
ncbi:MAG: exodeoxyribonuclease VII small subunit [Tannerella sp.]|jgi:exodeoxyribonuclease VII small subunit|nr:exodeoxyribonuclease VII small subunit [Tannerella sp.]